MKLKITLVMMMLLAGNTLLAQEMQPFQIAVAEKEPAEISQDQGVVTTKQPVATDAQRIRLTMEERAWLKAHPCVRIHAPDGIPPYLFWNNGRFDGLIKDYADIVSQRTGVHFEYVKVPNALADEKMQTHVIDVRYTYEIPKRRKKMLFTDPFVKVGWVLVRRGDTPFMGHLSRLNGRTIAVIKGFAIYSQMLKDYPEIKRYWVSSPLEGIQSVASGKADAFINTPASTAYFMRQEVIPYLRIDSLSEYPALPLMFGVRKDWPELVGIINKGVATITQADRNALFDKWIPLQMKQGLNWALIRKWGVVIGGALLLIFGVTLYWNRRLSREVDVRKQTEISLRESREKFRLAFENANVGMCLVALDGRIMQVNSMMSTIFGHSQAELVRMTVNDIAHPDYQGVSSKFIEKAVSGGDSKGMFEKLYLHKTGETVWGEVTSSLVRDADGNPLYFISHVQDVTDRKNAEQHMIKAKETWEKTFHAVPDLIAILDKEHRIIDVNRAMADRLHITREQSVGLYCYEAVHGSHAPPSFCPHTRLLQTGNGHTEEIREPLLDGDFMVTTSPLLDADGGLFGCVHVARDITERKQMEESLRKSEKLLNMTQHIAKIGGWEYHPESDRLVWTKEVYRIHEMPLDYDPTVADGLAFYAPESRELIENAMKKALSHGTPFDLELQFITKTGKSIWVRSVGKTERRNGKITKVYGTFQDITAFRRAISQLEEAKRHAESATRAKSEFLSNMSHELRTPMNAILGFAQLVQHDPNLTTRNQKHLQIIRRSGEHLLALINDVLDMSKIEAGGIMLTEKAFDLHGLLDDLKNMLGMSANRKGLSLVVKRGPDIPRYIRCDETKIRQILINLIGNAVKFTRSGSVGLTVEGAMVKAENETDTSESAHVSKICKLHFEIADTGPGIRRDEIETVFEPFGQTPDGRQRQEGTGLGLTISRKFVQLMGGDIAVQSEVGRGTTFAFDIRVHAADADASEKPTASRRVVGIEPGQPRYKILVVDDNRDNRKLFLKLLEPFEFILFEAEDGRNALESWGKHKPDLIWMDVRMPQMDGYEAARRIREREAARAANPKTVIIAQTASAFEEEDAIVPKAGCDDFLRKPFHESEIFDRLHRHLGVRFVYEPVETTIHRPSDDPEIRMPVKPTDLSIFPDDFLKKLRRAAMVADMDGVNEMIQGIKTMHAELANELAGLAEDFEYGQIGEIIEELEKRRDKKDKEKMASFPYLTKEN